MLEKLVKWLLGDAIASSVSGIALGAISGAATVATTGNLSKEALLIGAIGGASAALLGAGGRASGEKK